MQESTIEIDKVAAIFKLMGDKTRLTMVNMLDTNDYCVCEFVAVFNVSQPAISQHLRKLKDLGLVSETRNGQWIYYSLNKYSEFYPLIKDLLKHLPNQDFKRLELKQQGISISCD